MPNKNQLHTIVVRHTNNSQIPVPIRKNISNSKVKLRSISKMSQGSSKAIDRDIKKIESVFVQKEQPLIPLNLKISKEVTITHVNDTKNNIISKLKKLPDITIDLIKSEPVFKVPESPKLKTENTKKNTTPSNVLKDKGATHNIIFNSNKNLNLSETLKQKPKQVINKTLLITKSPDKEIVKNPKASNKIYSVLEKENTLRTSSPKILSKKLQSSPMIKSKSLKIKKTIEEIPNSSEIFIKEVKPVEKISNNRNTFSKELKENSDKDTVINNTELKTKKLANENYMLMDLSTNGEFNIVPASFILDSNNINDSEYRQFLMGINKSHLNSNMDMESSQNDTEKELSIIIEESDTFSDFIQCINTSLNINESNDKDSELESQSSCNRNSSPGITLIEQLRHNISYEKKENIMEKTEDKENFYFYNYTSKQPSLQHNDMNQTMNVFIEQEDNQLFQKMTSYNCGNLVENIPQNESKLIDFNIPKQQIQPNSIKDSTYLNSDENQNNNKRKQSQNQNELYKKQRLGVLKEF